MNNARANRTCGNCGHWLEHTGTEGLQGECHRYAPRPEGVVENGPSLSLVWPVTVANEFCGEWEKRG